MTSRWTLLKLLLGSASVATVAAGALALVPQSVPSALADGPTPAYTGPSLVRPIVGNLPVSVIEPVGDPNGPRLTSFELQPLVSPGGLIKVDGVNFGSQQIGSSKLCLDWTKVVVQNSFTDQSRLCINIIDWQDTRVIAMVPPDVTGVPDETAHVVLTRGDGEQSNALDTRFFAVREEVLLGTEPVNVTISCGNGSEQDNCSAGGADHWDGFVYSFGASGTDTFHYQLANGWGFESLHMSVSDGSVSTPATPPPGASDFTLKVNWSLGGTTTEAQYFFGTKVLGPKGVPMQ